MGQWLPVAAGGWTKWAKGVCSMVDGKQTSASDHSVVHTE